jgi:hypothetical protein
MYEVSNMIYLIRATKPGFFYKLSVNRALPEANVWLHLWVDAIPAPFSLVCNVFLNIIGPCKYEDLVLIGMKKYRICAK